jgi:hypothetical protein
VLCVLVGACAIRLVYDLYKKGRTYVLYRWMPGWVYAFRANIRYPKSVEVFSHDMVGTLSDWRSSQRLSHRAKVVVFEDSNDTSSTFQKLFHQKQHFGIILTDSSDDSNWILCHATNGTSMNKGVVNRYSNVQRVLIEPMTTNLTCNMVELTRFDLQSHVDLECLKSWCQETLNSNDITSGVDIPRKFQGEFQARGFFSEIFFWAKKIVKME